MRTPFPSLIACLPLMLAVAGCDRQSTTASQPKAESAAATAPAPTGTAGPEGALDVAQRGAPMPKDAFEAPDGRTTTLAAFKGQPLLVNLWATWCGPCVKEMPALDRLAAQTRGRLRVLTINQDSEQANDPVPAWWTEHKLANLELYRDRKTNLGFAFGGGQLPTTVLYDAKGNEVWRIVGGFDWEGDRAKTLIAEAVGKS